MTESVTIVGTPNVDPDEVIVVEGGTEYTGWQSVRITRRMEGCPNDYELTGTEVFPSEDQIVLRPGDSTLLKIGKDRVLTGYCNRYVASISAGRHQVQIIGRGACQDLVDCAATWPGQVVQTDTVLEVAQGLAAPFGITVAGEPGPSVGKGSLLIPYLVIMLGETAWEVIDRLCRVAGLVAFEQPDGSLLLAANPAGLTQKNTYAAGLKIAASGFEEGVNVIEASVTLSDDQRFATYEAYQFSFQPYREHGDQGNLIGTATDPGIQRPRKRVILMEQGNALGFENATTRAEWEASRRAGRARMVKITTDSWRDVSGKLYEPNSLAHLELPTLKITGVDWMISEVTYRRGVGGTLCDLTLMPPSAFAVEPKLLPYVVPIEHAGGRAAQ